MNDNDLIKLILEGSENAFTLLVQKYKKNIYFYVKSLGFRSEEVEEILQETFLKIYKNLSSFNSDNEQNAKFLTWAITIAKNISFNEKKRQKSFLRFFDLKSKLLNHSENRADENLPHDQFQKNEEYKLFQKCLEKLSLEFRNPLILSYFEDLSLNDIAKIENCPVGTVKSRIARGKEKLQDLILKENQYV